MRPLPALAVSALFLIVPAACGPGEEPQARPSANEANEAAPAPAAETANAAAAAAAAPAGPACAAPQQVEIDSASFEENGVPAFTPERLDAFRRSAAAAFAAAAESACAAGDVDPSRIAAIRRLLIQSASGATETAFYEDAESVGAGTLVFQYVFVEEGLALPDHADIRQGLGCWSNPERPVCAEREP